MNWQFRQHISQSKKSTSIQFFLKQLNEQFDIWFEMFVVKRYDYEQFKKFSMSKQNRQNAIFSHQNSRFYARNNAYQGVSQDRNDLRPRMKVSIKVESNEKSSEQESSKEKQIDTGKRRDSRTFEAERQKNDKNRKNRYRDDSYRDDRYRDDSYRDDRYRDDRYRDDRYRDDRYRNEKFKTRVYLITDDDQADNDQDENEDDCENYHQSHDLSFFDSDYDFDETDNSEIMILITTAISYVCRRCNLTFTSNNQLHKHLRFAKCIKTHSCAYFNDLNDNVSFPLIHFKIDPNKDVETEYDFKEWQYATAHVFLFMNIASNLSCIDFETDITLIDEDFFIEKAKNIFIRTMTTSISVRELDVAKHITDKYAMISLYFPKKNNSDESIKVVIIREVHLIKDLKAKLLIENDILDSEKIDISNSTNSAYIDSCEITIPIVIRAGSKSQSRSIHAIKTFVIPPKSECLMSVHVMISLSERDFLFEFSKTSNLFIYAHVVDSITSSILIRNDDEQFMKISRNFRLETLMKLDYINAYQANSEDVSDLAIRHFKSKHKATWFQKIIFVVAFCHNLTSNQEQSNKIVLSNEITIHESFTEAVKSLTELISTYAKLWIEEGFADLSMKHWMRILLKSDWEIKIKSTVKIYFMRTKNKELLNTIFDKFHEQKKLSWTKQSTLFNFSCFVVWRDSFEQRKERVMIDVRDLNAIVQSNAYFVFLQSDILTAVSDCNFISVIDCFDFFYQWRVHSSNRHKLTVIIHKGQESFNVAIMNYRNFSAYVQRQIDRVLRKHRQFARAYVNDIVIYSKTLKDHMIHLRKIFDVLLQNNISINSSKIFFGFSSVNLLKQHVTSFELSTNEQKLRAIANLTFSRNLTQLETYLELTKWFRQYIKHYASKSEFLQLKKILLLKATLKADNAKKSYAMKIKLAESSNDEITVFETLQKNLFKSTYLVHFDLTKQLYADLNFSDIDMNVMIYHVKSNAFIFEYSSRNDVQSIMFLSRLLTSTKTRYWSTELKLAELVWVLRKIRHMIESIKSSTIVYIDHDVALKIAKQISLTTSSTDKLNLRLIRASDYVQRFSLQIRHKSDKFHIVFDALSRLSFDRAQLSNYFQDDELDVLLHTASLVEMSNEFKNKILQNYKNDSDWIKISKMLNKKDVLLSFLRKNDDLIYRKEICDDSASFVFRRMCVSASLVENILTIIHNEKHFDFDRIYERIVSSWYIRGLISRFIRFLKRCLKCNTNRIRRHKSFDSLQFIMSFSISFHTLTIDFVLTLSASRTEFNVLMSIICKFSKRITVVSKKNIWKTFEWAIAMLKRLDLRDWELSKVIISDRDRKFLLQLWIILFVKLEVKLLYFTTYHFQTNDVSERTNQTMKIVLRYYLTTLKDFRNWLTVLNLMQRKFNNIFSSTTTKTSNEVCYDFTSCTNTNLIDSSANSSKNLIRKSIQDSIAFSQALFKHYYDKAHHNCQMQVNDWVLIRLHKEYNISSTMTLRKKLSQQYIDSFQIMKKIENLTYRLRISQHWNIHPVISIAQLEPSSSSIANNSFSSSIIMKSELKIDTVRSYEIEKILTKRNNRQREIEYLIRWLDYDPEKDAWRSLLELQNAMNLVNDFESRTSSAIHPFNSTKHRRKKSRNTKW